MLPYLVDREKNASAYALVVAFRRILDAERSPGLRAAWRGDGRGAPL